jgi:hypothetical protein
MPSRYKPSTPQIRPDRPGPPITAPGDKRSFDMRPSASKDLSRSAVYDRYVRPAESRKEPLLDPDPSE